MCSLSTSGSAVCILHIALLQCRDIARDNCGELCFQQLLHRPAKHQKYAVPSEHRKHDHGQKLSAFDHPTSPFPAPRKTTKACDFKQKTAARKHYSRRQRVGSRVRPPPEIKKTTPPKNTNPKILIVLALHVFLEQTSNHQKFKKNYPRFFGQY